MLFAVLLLTPQRAMASTYYDVEVIREWACVIAVDQPDDRFSRRTWFEWRTNEGCMPKAAIGRVARCARLMLAAARQSGSVYRNEDMLQRDVAAAAACAELQDIFRAPAARVERRF